MTDTCELVAEYRYSDDCLIRVYACYDTVADFDKRRVSFYDVYDRHGVCMNEGDPFYSFPTWAQCATYGIYSSTRKVVANESR